MRKNLLLELKTAGIRHHQRWRVRHVDLKVHEREIVTIIGPNGSGKSSTVQMALGLLQPDEGTAHQRKNLRIGYVPQKLHIDSSLPMKVKRFMCLGGRIPEASVDSALERTQVKHLKNQFVQHLSGGEFQRVLLARAIVRKPDLLVLDEPVQGVDASGVPDMYRLIVALRDEFSCGVLMISHDLHVVMSATDLVICLNGHMCCQGAPQDVIKDEAYHHLFSPQDMLSWYQHHHDHIHLPDGSVKQKLHDEEGHHHAG